VDDRTSLATVFKILPNGRSDTLRRLYGKLRGILVSDRATALNFWAMERRQICWAHLLRKFVSLEERAGPAGDLGRELLEYTGVLFRYWHDYRDGKLGRNMLRAWMAPVRQPFEALLERAVAAQLEGVSGSCADMLDHRAALWTFVDHDGVEPTSQVGDRRGGVQERPICFRPFRLAAPQSPLHHSVSGPRHIKPDRRISRLRLTAMVSSVRGYVSVPGSVAFASGGGFCSR